MKVLEINNQQTELTLEAGQEEHLFLMNPTNVRLHIQQQAGSKLLIHSISLCPETAAGNGTEQQSEAHNEIIVEQQAEGCETRILGLALLKGEQQLDLTTRVLHNVGGGYSDQLLKFVLDDQAQGSFYGELKVMPDAQKTEAHQTNRNILLSRSAKIKTKPQLEIYADDVKCSHGATTGQLDSNALFYMQQRGVSLSSARRLLLAAFLSDVLQGLPEETAEQIGQQIEEKL